MRYKNTLNNIKTINKLIPQPLENIILEGYTRLEQGIIKQASVEAIRNNKKNPSTITQTTQNLIIYTPTTLFKKDEIFILPKNTIRKIKLNKAPILTKNKNNPATTALIITIIHTNENHQIQTLLITLPIVDQETIQYTREFLTLLTKQNHQV